MKGHRRICKEVGGRPRGCVDLENFHMPGARSATGSLVSTRLRRRPEPRTEGTAWLVRAAGAHTARGLDCTVREGCGAGACCLIGFQERKKTWGSAIPIPSSTDK